MRNLKKFLALVLAMLMIVSASAVVSADFTDVPADNRYATAINDLAVKGIVKGTTDTTFGPTQDVQRWQMALFVARAMTGEVESDANWTNGIVPFVDVTEYKGAIEYAYVNGIINGWADPINGDAVFGPKDGITYVQALKMAVCALGYGEDLTWPWGYYNKAAALGLTANMAVNELDAKLNRAETAQIIYNMIYAAPANGELTIAEKNFSINTPANTTLFVVVATPKQYYANREGDGNYKATGEVAGTWMGIQPLVKGVPAGTVTYLPCEKLGIAAANVEDYFNRTVELINYDAATGEFTGVVLGDAPVVVTHKDVSLANSNKNIVYKNVNYTPVTSLTGSVLHNEIVVYEGANITNTAMILPTDADGNIIDVEGTVVARLLSNGQYWETFKGKTITAEKALEKYGIYVQGEGAEYVKFDTINGTALVNKAFQLELYDDDKDGLYERAVARQIYMGSYYEAYNANQTDAFANTTDAYDGMLYDLGYVVKANAVTYTNNAAKTEGAIVVYTYNPQRGQVNVIDILEQKTGVITKIDGRGFVDAVHGATNTANIVKVTVDGTVYTLGFDMEAKTSDVTKWSIDGKQLGATMKENAESGLYYEFTSKDDLTAFVDKITVGDEIEFYAYNGYILMYDVVEPEAAVYDFAVVEEFVDFDFGEIYLDMYVGGEFEEEAKVTYIDGKELAKLSNYKFSMLISKQELFYPGLIYQVDKVEDAYEIYDLITEENYTEYGLINAKVADDDYKADDETKQEGIIDFDNGSTKDSVRANRLRTNSKTVFYFIEEETLTAEEIAAGETPDPMETTVTVFIGNAGDNDIVFDADTQIWTDSLGTAKDRASVVYVINPVSYTFFDTYHDNVWVLGFMGAKSALETVTAEEALGEAIEDYDLEDDEILYKYYGTFYNMDDGSKVSYILSTEKIQKSGSSFRLLEIDENNVFTGKGNWAWLDGQKQDANSFTYLDGKRDYALYGIEDKNGGGSNKNAGDWGKPNGTLNYFDWVYYNVMNIDVAGKEKVPTSILDVALVDDIIEAEYDDGYAMIYDLKNDEPICDEDDGITDVIVIDLSGKITEDEEALEYLMSAPQVLFNSSKAYAKDGTLVFVVATAVGDK